MSCSFLLTLNINIKGLLFYMTNTYSEPANSDKKLIKNLWYHFGFRGEQVHALKNLNLDVFPSEFFGYLGPNGSGKTTTIKLLLELIFPTSGQIKIMDRTDISSPYVKKSIGYLPEGSYYRTS